MKQKKTGISYYIRNTSLKYCAQQNDVEKGKIESALN